LLLLAIVASSALVFTNRVELLKLAVIVALWAAVIAAFVSVVYRRQSDLDQARARDLKLVYDLQLDREISARREYELQVETQLRRELASEMRSEAADEVAALRAELAALRNNLEIVFGTDLAHRPALETDRTTVWAYSDWQRDTNTTDQGPLAASRIAPVVAAGDSGTESSIIDVPEEPPQPDPFGWQPDQPGFAEPQRRHAREHAGYEGSQRRTASRSEPQSAGGHGFGALGEDEWRPAPAEGEWLPAGTPGSNWVSTNGVPPAEAGGGRHASPAANPASPEPAPPRGGGQHGPDKGQSVAELLARLRPSAGVGSGGRRRRRDG
jgi:hypothetical protein